MSAIELWTCDWHASAPESGDYVNEDQARDESWIRIERHVDTPSGLGNGKTWSRLEVDHICPECLKDPECLDWIAAEGFAGYFGEDVERLEEARRVALR